MPPSEPVGEVVPWAQISLPRWRSDCPSRCSARSPRRSTARTSTSAAAGSGPSSRVLVLARGRQVSTSAAARRAVGRRAAAVGRRQPAVLRLPPAPALEPAPAGPRPRAGCSSRAARLRAGRGRRRRRRLALRAAGRRGGHGGATAGRRVALLTEALALWRGPVLGGVRRRRLGRRRGPPSRAAPDARPRAAAGGPPRRRRERAGRARARGAARGGPAARGALAAAGAGAVPRAPAGRRARRAAPGPGRCSPTSSASTRAGAAGAEAEVLAQSPSLDGPRPRRSRRPAAGSAGGPRPAAALGRAPSWSTGRPSSGQLRACAARHALAGVPRPGGHRGTGRDRQDRLLHQVRDDARAARRHGAAARGAASWRRSSASARSVSCSTRCSPTPPPATELLTGAAAGGRPGLRLDVPPDDAPPTSPFTMLHGLYWLTSNLAAPTSAGDRGRRRAVVRHRLAAVPGLPRPTARGPARAGGRDPAAPASSTPTRTCCTS